MLIQQPKHFQIEVRILLKDFQLNASKTDITTFKILLYRIITAMVAFIETVSVT